MEKIYPLPRKAIERNKLRRILSFDTEIGGGYTEFIEAGREDDIKNGKIKLYLYPKDVADDGKLLHSTTRKIMTSQLAFSVRNDLYIELDGWSRDYKKAIILPPTPQRMPESFRNVSSNSAKAFFEMLNDITKTRTVQTTIMTGFTEQINQLSEQVKQSDPKKRLEEVKGLVKELNETMIHKDIQTLPNRDSSGKF